MLDGKVMFSRPVYDFLKFFALVVQPALTTLYFTLATLWNWPNPDQVMGTSVAINTFLGILLGISSNAYNNSDDRFHGVIDVHTTEEGAKTFSLELNDDPYDLELKDEVLFKVNSPNVV